MAVLCTFRASEEWRVFDKCPCEKLEREQKAPQGRGGGRGGEKINRLQSCPQHFRNAHRSLCLASACSMSKQLSVPANQKTVYCKQCQNVVFRETAEKEALRVNFQAKFEKFSEVQKKT